MIYKIIPPNSWSKKIEINEEINIYERLMQFYKDTEIMFKIIKQDGEIKAISKSQCNFLANNFAEKIIDTFPFDNRFDQLKIMAVIGASEESAIFMLASLLLGAHHCICFEDLSEDSISKRLKIFQPHIVVCRKEIKKKIIKALSLLGCGEVKLLIIDLDNQNETLRNNLINKKSFYNSKSSLFTLFTSGSTGVPKAITHGVRDYLKYAEYTTNKFFGIRKGSVIFTAVDAGWINGHTYAFYGPLLLGAITVINENSLLVSMPNLLANYLLKLNVDCFYTSVTLLRLLMSIVPFGKTLNDLAGVNVEIERIGSCGEPLAHSVGEWSIKFFKPKIRSIVNTYFQTETGGVLVAPLAEDGPPLDYSCVGKPSSKLGIVIAESIMNRSQLEEEGLDPNELLVCNKWDGIFKEVIADKETKYFTNDGYFRLYDVGYFDEQGNLFIGGRSDDVINVSGHRIATSEIESVCLSLKNVKEACAISVPDTVSGSRVVLYFSSNSEEPDLIKSLNQSIKNIIKDQLTRYHLPKEVHYFSSLPKTKSGKIMRRVMRELYENGSLSKSLDYSTFANKNDFIASQKLYLESIKRSII